MPDTESNSRHDPEATPRPGQEPAPARAPVWALRQPGPALAFAALMLTVSAVFWRHLLTSDVLFYRDITFASFPRLLELRNIIHSGVLPLWNPFEHFGEPVAANPNFLLFYPTTWLAWLLPAAYAFKLHFVLHFLLLAGGAFLLARRAGCGPAACYFAGAFSVLSGAVMSLGSFYNTVAAAAWMPLVLLAADSLVRAAPERRATSGVLLAGALAMQFFAGEPFISVMSAGLALLWCVTQLRIADCGLRISAIRGFSRLALAACFAAGFAAIQLLPALWHLRQTARAQLPYEHAFFWSLHPLKIVEVLVPRIWGDQFAHFRLPWLFLEGREPFLPSVFVGIVPLALAVIALLLRRDRFTAFWAIAAAVCFALALGSYTPLGWVFYHAIPLFRLFRFPVKFMIPASLAVAQLAAMAIDRLYRARELSAEEEQRAAVPAWPFTALQALVLVFGAAWSALTAFILIAPAAAGNTARAFSRAFFTPAFVESHRGVLGMDSVEAVERAALWLREAIPTRLPYVLLAVLVLAAILHLARRVSPPSQRAALAALTVFAAGSAVIQLGANHYGLNPVVSARYFRDRSPLPEALSAREAPLRVFVEPAAPGALPPAGVLNEALDFLPPAAQINYAQRLSLMCAAGAEGVETSFTVDPELFLDARQGEMQRFVYKVGQYAPIGRLLALGSVEWALLPGGVTNPGPGFQQTGIFADPRQFPVRAFRLVDSVPRAYLVAARAAEIFPTGPATLDRLVSLGFDLRRQVVVERQAFSEAQMQAAARSVSEVAGEARIVHRDAARVEIEAHAPDPAYLVLTDSYSPGWRASVDGKPADLLRANQIFRAVPLPPGTHRVVFTYRPASLLYGALLSLCTAVFAAALVWREWRRERRAARAAS